MQVKSALHLMVLPCMETMIPVHIRSILDTEHMTLHCVAVQTTQKMAQVDLYVGGQKKERSTMAEVIRQNIRLKM